MSGDQVERVGVAIYELRESRRLTEPTCFEMGRALTAAAAAEVAARESYDPEADRRLLWGREVLRHAGERGARRIEDRVLEEIALMLLGIARPGAAGAGATDGEEKDWGVA